MGAIISYRTRKYIYLLLGPLAGYASGASAFDVYVPWQMFLVALGAQAGLPSAVNGGDPALIDMSKVELGERRTNLGPVIIEDRFDK